MQRRSTAAMTVMTRTRQSRKSDPRPRIKNQQPFIKNREERRKHYKVSISTATNTTTIITTTSTTTARSRKTATQKPNRLNRGFVVDSQTLQATPEQRRE